jgi:hypothetical protein
MKISSLRLELEYDPFIDDIFLFMLQHSKRVCRLHIFPEKTQIPAQLLFVRPVS